MKNIIKIKSNLLILTSSLFLIVGCGGDGVNGKNSTNILVGGTNISTAMAEVIEDIAGNANGKSVTATQLNSIDGVSGAIDGRDYTSALKVGTFIDKTNPKADEIKAITDSVNAKANAMAEVIEDIAGNTNATSVTATQLNTITGITGAIDGRDYTSALKVGTFANKATPTSAEIQAIIDSVNAPFNAMAEVVEDIAGNTNGVSVTATQLNTITGITGAISGRDYASALKVGTFVNKVTPTSAEIQAVIDSVNAKANAMVEVVEDIAGNTNGVSVTATQLNTITGVSGAIIGRDYTSALKIGTFVNKATPTSAEIQAIIDSVNAPFNSMAEVVEDIAGNTNGVSVTFTQLNLIVGVSRAITGKDYTAGLIAGTFVNRTTPTPAEIQVIIDLVNKIDIANPFGTASESSIYVNGSSFPASNAIDNQPTTFSTTNTSDPKPWVQVDFNSTARVTAIHILGRGDAIINNRLNNVTVYLSKYPFTHTKFDIATAYKVAKISSTSTTVKTDVTFTIPTEQYGQYIILARDSGDTQYIELATIEVYGEVFPDLTKDKIVTASTINTTFVGANAVDTNLTSLTVNDNGDTNGYLQVYFFGEATVDTIRILNRSDNPINTTTYSDRLNGAGVCISDTPIDDTNFLWANCKYTYTLTGSTDIQTQSVPKIKGRYLIIKASSTQTNGIGLANIEVNGAIVSDVNIIDTASMVASQGSTLGGTLAGDAIDNNISTHSETNNVSNTLNWWQLPFHDDIKVSGVMVINRQSPLSGILGRLEGAKVYLSNIPCPVGANCATVLAGATEIYALKGIASPQYIPVATTTATGKYIIIKGVASPSLHMATVEVYGTIIPSP